MLNGCVAAIDVFRAHAVRPLTNHDVWAQANVRLFGASGKLATYEQPVI